MAAGARSAHTHTGSRTGQGDDAEIRPAFFLDDIANNWLGPDGEEIIYYECNINFFYNTAEGKHVPATSSVKLTRTQRDAFERDVGPWFEQWLKELCKKRRTRRLTELTLYGPTRKRPKPAPAPSAATT